jgi:hypothetical protein
MKFIERMALAVLIMFSINTYALVQFPNPSLDEDAANIGCPDGWNIPKTTKVSLVTDKVSHGCKAGRFDDGYVLLSCDMQEPNLSGLKLTISFDAAGLDGAELGVAIGCNRESNGKVAWGNSTILWNRKLNSDYTKINITTTLPGNAVKDRLVFTVYRSNKQGVVWLDNFSITSSHGKELTIDEKKALTILGRDWNYLASRISQTLKIKTNNPELLQARKETSAIISQIESEDTSLLKQDLNSKLTAVLVKVNKALVNGEDNIAYFGDAYERQNPDEIIPGKIIQSTEIITLGNEYQALGLSVANILDKMQLIPITITGSDKFTDKIEVRRQVFMMNWYKKERELIADPLTLLPFKDQHWTLPLEPGAIVKLYISFKVRKDCAGEFPLKIKAGDSSLQATVKVKPVNLPTEPFFANFQCVYPHINPAGKYPELVARDLAAHYTTGIEFPFIPKVKFNPDGSIASEDFKGSSQAKWMYAYTKENIILGLFWQGAYKGFPLVDNQNKLPFINENKELLPVWINAYTNLLGDWLKFAAQRGVSQDKFMIWGMDELSSHEEFANAPGSKIKIGIEIYKLAKKVAPGSRTMVTAGNYSLPQDVAAFAPYVDIILAAWPLPTSLNRWAPREFNPRKEFFDKTLPMLKAERARRGLTIDSYKVDAGKAEPALNARAYPVCAVGIGFTGVGSWAYNCSSGGTTWNDTDGGILDYIFIYNGEENHPLNKTYNVTGEIIVPSIRWEAMRMGIQDAKILLYLKDRMEKGKCEAETTTELEAILQQAENYGKNLNYTCEGINKISTRIRELITKTK